MSRTAWDDPPGFDRWDAVCLLGLAALWYSLVALRTDLLPLQAWDESRNAVNAYWMAHGEGWLVPRFEGAPDHWNTKPPLLIWCMAGLLRLGLPILIAVRLPAFLSALLTIALIWAAGRYGLRDRVAGLTVGLLLCSSKLYFGLHVARTGDYDAMLTLFATGGVLAFWMAVRDGRVRRGWFAGFAATVVLAVMTKGVAGLFAPSGLFLFALLTRRLRALLTDPRVWGAVVTTLVLCAGYYLSRERYDPSYLQSVASNELGGRFAGAAADPKTTLGSFMPLLAQQAGLALYVLPLAALPLLGADGRRRSLALACLIVAATILLVISVAQTKYAWYAAPLMPLLSIAAAIGLADLYGWLRRQGAAGRWLAPAGVLLLLAGSLPVLDKNQRSDIYIAQYPQNGQFHYGGLLDKLAAEHAGRVLVLDTGLWYQNAPWPNYNPLLRLYASIARARGLAVDIAGEDARPEPGTLTATCDFAVVPNLLDRPGFQVTLRDRWCVAGVEQRTVSVR